MNSDTHTKQPPKHANLEDSETIRQKGNRIKETCKNTTNKHIIMKLKHKKIRTDEQKTRKDAVTVIK